MARERAERLFEVVTTTTTTTTTQDCQRDCQQDCHNHDNNNQAKTSNSPLLTEQMKSARSRRQYHRQCPLSAIACTSPPATPTPPPAPAPPDPKEPRPPPVAAGLGEKKRERSGFLSLQVDRYLLSSQLRTRKAGRGGESERRRETGTQAPRTTAGVSCER